MGEKFSNIYIGVIFVFSLPTAAVVWFVCVYTCASCVAEREVVSDLCHSEHTADIIPGIIVTHLTSVTHTLQLVNEQISSSSQLNGARLKMFLGASSACWTITGLYCIQGGVPPGWFLSSQGFRVFNCPCGSCSTSWCSLTQTAAVNATGAAAVTRNVCEFSGSLTSLAEQIVTY